MERNQLLATLEILRKQTENLRSNAFKRTLNVDSLLAIHKPVVTESHLPQPQLQYITPTIMTLKNVYNPKIEIIVSDKPQMYSI